MTPARQFIKRIMDITGALGALFLLWPVLLVCALAVRIDSPGSVFFLQERVGKDKKLFSIYKFRTMVTGAVNQGLGYNVVRDDSRITRTGHFLRRWSLDELPQIFNVLKGDMSLVGPRPTLKYQVDEYTDFQIRRLEVKPGITSLASIRGRNLLSWPERIELDVWYIDNYSIWLDIKIMFQTVGVVFSGEGVYGDDGKAKKS